MSQKSMRWGIIGLGVIAGQFARALGERDEDILQAVASRSEEKARAFAEKHGARAAYDSYEALLEDPEVDAVYIATVHPFHAEWSIRAARAGKHILCEKPLTLNASEADALQREVEKCGVAFMEAFMYRHHPQTVLVKDLLQAGKIGQLRHIEASFCFDQGPLPEGRHQADALGGGGILDVGCYPVSFARMAAGVALGKAFAEPLEFKATGHLDEATGVDTWACGVMKFEEDITASVVCGVRLPGNNEVRLFGSEGTLLVPAPWFCSGEIKFLPKGGNAEAEVFDASSERSLYSFQAEALAEAVQAGRRECAAMSPVDSLGNMRCLDAWRSEINFLYRSEKPDGFWPTIDGLELRRAESAPIPTVDLPSVPLPVSRLVLGSMLPPNMAMRSLLFDEFFRLGGNAFDTAFVYSEASEKSLGQWIANRGIRKEIFLLAKGAHTPFCTPEGIEEQLITSLERLQTDNADLYLMHRDNPDVPVGEFVEALCSHLRAGRFLGYGFSNWSLERVREAVEYAGANGLPKPAAVSNQFSLAKMVAPPWPDCLSLDPAFREFLTENSMANFAWTSMARGFFVYDDAPGKVPDKIMATCFRCPENEERKVRARELAARKNVSVSAVVGAYVLQQSFPSFALIGPRNLAELEDSITCTSVDLTPEEMQWLEHG